MITADTPVSESFRLADLASYDIMDTQAEDDFDELVELASQICNSPISLITLLNKDRQWFKAKKGVDDSQTSRDVAFCSHAILQDDVFVVEDAAKDIRFFDNPFVTGDMNVRFYAGAPIMSPSGYKLGTLCVIDNKPRKLSESEERALVILSNQVTKLLDLRKKNILLRERAEEIISIKSDAISKVLHAQEEEKKAIALNLHEDMAQGIASSIFILQTAEGNDKQAMSLVKTASNQLKDILANMQALSYSITPHVIDLLPARDLVMEYADKISATFPFSIKVKTAGDINTATTVNAIHTIRIIEQWLKVLADKKDVSMVNITLQTNEKFELLIEDDGHMTSFELFKKRIAESLVYERAFSCGGTVEWSISPAGKNVLKVRLPIAPADKKRAVA